MRDQSILPPLRNFFGRREDLEKVIDTIISTPNAARIALLGSGGIGKTALASQVLRNHRIEDKFKHRRYFIACDERNDKDDLVTTIAAALDIQGSPLQKQIIERLSQDKTLLVLDNFESSWESPTARSEVENFLVAITAIDNLALLITMRGSERPAPGKVAWTRPFLPQLTPLDMASAKQLFMSAVDCPENDPDLEALLKVVDCVPLAVELLAAQGESPRVLLERWQEEQSSMLTRSEPEDRRSSLDFSIQISLASPRMNPDALSLLKILSLLPDGVDYRQLDAVFSSTINAKKSLSVLWQTSLAYRDNAERARVLSPIRAYMMRYHFPEYDNIVPTMTYYMGVAKLATEVGKPQGSVIAKRLTSEIGNLHTMVNLALGPQMTPCASATLLQAATRAAIDLSKFTRYTGLGNLETLRLALTVASERMDDRTLQADILYNLAWALNHGALSVNHGAESETESLCREALSMYQETQNLYGQAECMWLLAKTLKETKRYPESRLNIDQALQLAKQSGDLYCEAKCLSSLSEFTFREGDLETASQQSQEALRLFKDLEHLANVGYSLSYLGHIESRRSQYTKALQYYQEATHFIERAGTYRSNISLWIDIGDLHAKRSDFLKARNAYERAWNIMRERGLEKDIMSAYTWLSLAEAAVGLQEEETARKWLDQAMEMLQAKNRIHGQMYCKILYGDLAFERGASSYEEAAQWYKKALDDSRSLRGVEDKAFANIKYGILKTAQSEMELGLRHLVTAQTLYRKMGSTNGQGKGVFRLGEWFLSMGELNTALQLFRAALPVCHRTEAKREEAGCLQGIREVRLKQPVVS